MRSYLVWLDFLPTQRVILCLQIPGDESALSRKIFEYFITELCFLCFAARIAF